MSFYSGLAIAAQAFRLELPRQFSRLANGQVIPSRAGASYWRGSASLAPAYHANAAEYEVDLMALDRPGAVFDVYDARFNGPRADPGGVILDTATPSLHTVSGDNGSIRIAGLPGSYVISKGDYIGWTRANGSKALHRARATVTASLAGLTPLVAVEPLVRAGDATGVGVVLVRPTCRALVVQSAYGSGRPLITDGGSFDWQEALR